NARTARPPYPCQTRWRLRGASCFVPRSGNDIVMAMSYTLCSHWIVHRTPCTSPGRCAPRRMPIMAERKILHSASSRMARLDEEEILALAALVAVGIGYAALTRDGTPVYEAECGDVEHALSVREAERLAATEPNHDWRIHLVALRDERHYRRDADGSW